MCIIDLRVAHAGQLGGGCKRAPDGVRVSLRCVVWLLTAGAAAAAAGAASTLCCIIGGRVTQVF